MRGRDLVDMHTACDLPQREFFSYTNVLGNIPPELRKNIYQGGFNYDY
jgi:hypothetical protein